MTNEILLAKSNLKKTRGSSIGITALLSLISFLLCLVLLILVGFKPQAKKFTYSHHAPTGAMIISYSSTNYENPNAFLKYIQESEDVVSYEAYSGICPQISVPFGSGTMFDATFIESLTVLKSRTFNEIVLVDEVESITKDYIYLPYSFHTGGGFNLGDDFLLDIPGNTKHLRIKGFYDSAILTNAQSGSISVAVDDATLKNIKENCNAYLGECIYYTLKDGVREDVFVTNYMNSIAAEAINFAQYILTSSTLANRTFMSDIISVAFLSVSSILILVVLIMLTNSISNYVKENMKEIGALKAIGYKSSNIRLSLLFQFLFMAGIGVVIGIGLSYIAYPIMANVLNTQTAILYKITFVPEAVFPTIFLGLGFVAIVITLCSHKIKAIEPIVALRDGIASHSFKRNFIPLDKSKFGLGLSLALKSFFKNMKQNIVTGIIVVFLIFSGALGIGMMYNFAIEPAYGILTFEVFDGLIVTDTHESALEVEEYLNQRDDVLNLRTIWSMLLTDKDGGGLNAYVINDPSLLRNKMVVYKGRTPKYDNEVVISGKYAKDCGYSIGDEIKLTFGDVSYNYLVVGYMQTTNNGGQEAYMTMAALNQIYDSKDVPGYYWFDSTDAKSVIEDTKETFGSHITSTTAFQDIVDSQLSLFVVISILVAILSISIAVFVMVLVLYLLIKALMHTNRFEYGILKANGYTSKELMLQTSISFMPSILVGAVLGIVCAMNLSNPFMTVCMKSFGIMKCSFVIPFLYVFLYAIGLIIISFGITYLLSRKIKNIEPYSLLIAE